MPIISLALSLSFNKRGTSSGLGLISQPSQKLVPLFRSVHHYHQPLFSPSFCPSAFKFKSSLSHRNGDTETERQRQCLWRELEDLDPYISFHFLTNHLLPFLKQFWSLKLFILTFFSSHSIEGLAPITPM